MVTTATLKLAAASVPLLLSLAGCSLVATPPIGGLDPDQRDAYIAQSIEYAWQAANLPAVARPVVGKIQLVGIDEWGELIASCMANLGYTTYFGGLGGYTRTTLSAADDGERLALYRCTARIQLDPDAFAVLNAAQLDYLYDYYLESLIPCLEVNGIHIRTVQTREQFHDRAGGWNPYVSNGGALLGGTGRIAAKCPAYPEGYGAGYASQ